jgi:hypothetical protein
MCIIVMRTKATATESCELRWLCSCKLAMAVVMLVHTGEEYSHLDLSKV